MSAAKAASIFPAFIAGLKPCAAQSCATRALRYAALRHPTHLLSFRDLSIINGA